MKTRAILPVLASALAWIATPAHAQNFSSGSTGKDGALNISADTTLDTPVDGVFNFTTVNIPLNRTLRFKRNAANTPIYILASGAVTVSGSINLDGGSGNGVIGGLAGAGGFDGGSPASISVPPGAGYGPGAGKGGTGTVNADGAGGASFANVGPTGPSVNKGTPYGNALLIPMVGGSGGGGTTGNPGSGGGGGGGGVLIASTIRIDVTGSISARGGGSSGGALNGGSGGGIRLVAPVVAGGGLVTVDANSGAGLGRIRVDALDRSLLGFSFGSASVTSVGSLMMVFPTPVPRLDIIEAAGTPIAEGSAPVLVLLPFGSTPNRTIKVQARDFSAQVPITLVLTPDHGAPLTYTGKIDNTAGKNPAVLSLDVVLPVNEQTTVNVYSK